MLNHGGGYCTAHGGGRRLVGARPRELKVATVPDVYRETFLKTNNVLESRKVALSVPVVAPPVAARSVAAPPPPPPTKARKAAALTTVNPIYLRPLETKVSTVSNEKSKRRPAKQAKPSRKAAPTRLDVIETTVVYNAARYATRRGLSKFFNGASAVANDSPDEFAAAAAYQHLASLPGAAPSFTVTPLVSVPYGSQAAYERLMRLDANGNGATLPLSAWWTQRREIVRVLDDRRCGGVIVKELSLSRNLRKMGAIAPKSAPPRRSSPRRSPARASVVKSSTSIAAKNIVRDIGSDGVSLEDVASPPPVDLPSLILPDVVEPKPGFLDSLTPRPKRNAVDMMMQAARTNVPASAPPAAKRKRANATPSKAAAEREKALFAKAEGRKPAKTRASATTETPSRESEVALLGLDTAATAAATTTKRSTRSEKTKEFFHLRTGGWFDNRMAGEQQQQQLQQQQQEQPTTTVEPVIDDGIGQDEFA